MLFKSNNFQKLILILLLMTPTVGVWTQTIPANASTERYNLIDMDESILIPSEVQKNIYYVDLEVLEGVLSDLRLLNENGEVVLLYSLKNIPNDALYELDLSHVEEGQYEFFVRSYTNEIRKEIIVE